MKIALKWGIPNTDNEQMAYELKASWDVTDFWAVDRKVYDMLVFVLFLI